MNSIFTLAQDRQTLDNLLAKAPVLPNVVAKILVLDKDSDDYYEEVLSLSSEDPFIAGKIIHLANSAALAGRTKIETLTQAVIRVGVNQVSTLITSISLTKSFKPTQQSHRNLWLHSLQVATAATKIAQLNKINTELAYLAGLLHEIGRFVLLVSDIDKFNSLSEDFKTTGISLINEETAIFGFNSIDVTINTLKAWQIPGTITSAIITHLLNTISEHIDPEELLTIMSGIDTSSEASSALEEILSIADVLSMLIQNNPDINTLEESEVEEMVRKALASFSGSDLFLPPAALAKSLIATASEASELASSLGVG
ncbi:MAG: HDOD domain-containing protein [Porticoccus sp.]|nr:HDOD domain-containing protein [Porticoccus sp.]